MQANLLQASALIAANQPHFAAAVDRRDRRTDRRADGHPTRVDHGSGPSAGRVGLGRVGVTGVKKSMFILGIMVDFYEVNNHQRNCTCSALKVSLIHGQFSKCGHAVFCCFTGHVPASLLPEVFSKLTGIFFQQWKLNCRNVFGLFKTLRKC